MALPANRFRLSVALALAALSAVTEADTFDSTAAPRSMDVVQFGMPRDAKFVFCSNEDCPERTLKHVDTPPPQPAAMPIRTSVAPARLPVAAPVTLTPVLDPAPVAKKEVVKKKPKKRKKRAVKYECKPVTAAK